MDASAMRLLAEAVAGRSVLVAVQSAAGAGSWTDGERIHLCAHDDPADRRLGLIVQAALLAGQALETRAMAALVGRPDVARRFLVLEVERCCRLIGGRLPRAFLARLEPFSTGHAPAGPQASLALARTPGRLPAPPAWYGTLKPWKVARRQGRTTATTRLTEQRLAGLEAALKEVGNDDEDGDDEETLRRSRFWQLLSSPFGRDGLFSRFMRDVLDMKSSPGGRPEPSGTEGSSEMVSGRLSSRVRDVTHALRSALSPVLPDRLALRDSGARRYPEWDEAAGRYRERWVSVEDVAAHAGAPHFDVQRVLRASGERALQRSLATLGLGLRRHRDQAQGDDLVLDRLLRLAVDRRCGHAADERIHSAPLRTRRDLGVQILVDASSSTLERGVDGVSVFERHVQAGWQACRVLARLGDRVALHAFHSWGRALVRFQPVKSFDEPLSAAQPRRLGRLAVAGYTRCGAAIRHAVTMLDERAGTPHKVLLLISDGFPYDDQYEGEYAIADTRKAIEEARARGIAVACLSVGGDADVQRLERVYGATRYLALERPEQLPGRLHLLIRAALAARRCGPDGVERYSRP